MSPASDPVEAEPLPVVDFHSHHVAPGVPALAPVNATDELRRAWRRVAREVGDVEATLVGMDRLGITRRVLSAPPSMVTPDGTSIAPDVVTALNDHLAEVVTAHPDRFAGLATVDAYAGEGAADTVAAAVAAGFTGIVVDCAHQGVYLDAPRCRPALAAAAEAGLAVFVHPVSPAALSADLGALGRAGTSLARGTAVSASLLALLTTGALDDLPGLRLVFPMLSAAGLHLAAASDPDTRIRADAPPHERWHVYVDTMGFAPPAIRFAVDLLGADHVVAGSDWPVPDRPADRRRVTDALTRAGLTPADRHQIAHRTATTLLTPATPHDAPAAHGEPDRPGRR
ncbi:amidohydrolase family protein [Micromonospora sp. SH-82]|uniref:amidohydrolase family protein n=1 Tax=Micromonospora sp. SH-82 TaxID=3132938 RepID=UPI003EC05233